MYKKLTIIVFTCGILLGKAQTSNWFLGYRTSLKFTKSGSPARWSPAAYLSTTMQGSTGLMNSVTDANGKFIFGTDGINLFSYKSNVGYVLANGQQGGNLLGSFTATQSSIIIPLNGTGNSIACLDFLIFTTVDLDADPTNGNGLSITYVKATSPSVGVYDILGSNINSVSLVNSSPLFNSSSFAEKLCATEDGVGGYWVAAHSYFEGSNIDQGDNYYMFHIAPDFLVNNATVVDMQTTLTTNITTVPPGQAISLSNTSGFLTQQIGTVIYKNGTNHSAAKGQMKFNRKGTRLAMTNRSQFGYVDLYDFDKSTGLLSNLNTIDFSTVVPGKQYSAVYGLEFGPDLKPGIVPPLLYVSELEVTNNLPSNIYQINLNTPTATPVIVKSAMPTPGISQSGPNAKVFGAMQVALDNKIYVAKYGLDYLSEIRYPDALQNPTIGNGSSCGFILKSILLVTNNALLYSSVGGEIGINLPTMISYKPSCSEGAFIPAIPNCNNCE